MQSRRSTRDFVFFISRAVFLSTCLSLCLFACLPVCLPFCACLPVCLSTCLSVSVFLSVANFLICDVKRDDKTNKQWKKRQLGLAATVPTLPIPMVGVFCCKASHSFIVLWLSQEIQLHRLSDFMLSNGH